MNTDALLWLHQELEATFYKANYDKLDVPDGAAEPLKRDQTLARAAARAEAERLVTEFKRRLG